MSVQKKTLLFFFAIMATIAVSLFITTQIFVIGYFNQLETSSIQKNEELILNTIDNEYQKLTLSGNEYGVWDDTCQFILDGNQDFIDNNLSPDSFNRLELNTWVITNQAGEIIFEKFYDLETGQFVDAPPDFGSILKSQLINGLTEQNQTKHGLVQVGNEYLLTASQAVIHTDGSGPVCGTMVVGRYVNEKVALSGFINPAFTVDIRAYDSIRNIPYLNQLSENSPISVHIDDLKTISGYGLLTGLDGKPLSLVHLSSPRNIFTSGMMKVLYLLGVIVVIGWIGAFLLVWFYSRTIFKPLKSLRDITNQVSRGDFEVQIPPASKDEIGEVYLALTNLTDYLKSLAGVTSKVSEGDLTRQVTARSEMDQLSIATNQMVDKLRGTIQVLAKSVQDLNATSSQLVTTATEAGEATSQIATTIQQVAHGATQQTEAVNKTASSIEQMVRVIDGVARGATDQATAATEASTVTSLLTDSIQQVNTSTAEMVQQSANAAETTAHSTRIVQDTLAGMKNIRASVSISNDRVLEMGSRSEEIGEIVDTIEEIASQTNLLALNAAIEAARAEAQATHLTEYILNQQMVSQARLVDSIVAQIGDDTPNSFWEDLAKKCGLDTVLMTDGDGVISKCSDPGIIGFRFSDNPGEQSYAFRKLLNEKDGVVTQPPQKRSVDSRVFKFVGVSRSSKPGIIQVAFDHDSLTGFQLQVGGFSVVANEVYRLAENAKTSAKNIAVLVKQINKSVSEATQAMHTSTDQVEKGVQQAAQAEAALQEISMAFEAVNAQAANARAATQKMSEATNKLVEAVDSVSAIVEENTAATEEMSAGANEVNTSIENIAAVSEENSAAVQQVSASAEEMNEHAQACSVSARELAELASKLQRITAEFKL